jgi:hypothetical protein
MRRRTNGKAGESSKSTNSKRKIQNANHKWFAF